MSIGGGGGHVLQFIVVVGACPCLLMVVVVVVCSVIGVEGVVVEFIKNRVRKRNWWQVQGRRIGNKVWAQDTMEMEMRGGRSWSWSWVLLWVSTNQSSRIITSEKISFSFIFLGTLSTLHSPTYSSWTPPGVHLEYNQICKFLNHPAGVHVESAQTPSGLHPNPTELKQRGI